jgi:hypothetical protein
MRSRLAKRVSVQKSGPGTYRVEFRLDHTRATALLGDDCPGFVFDGHGFDRAGAQERRKQVIAMLVDALCPPADEPPEPSDTDLKSVG